MQDTKNRLVAELAKECKSMDDIHNMLKDLFKDTIQKVVMSIKKLTTVTTKKLTTLEAVY
ncbi:hypothetical protein JCM14036_30940 [Desulfotomaculum defluvii]